MIRRPLLPLLLASLAAACASSKANPQPTPPPGLDPAAEPIVAAAELTLESARATNDAAYERDGARLAAESPGQWVLIVHGASSGPWATFDAAWAAAGERAAGSPHAYLYRAGIDDVDVTFALSPFLSSQPSWTQMGRRMQRPLELTIAAVNDTWFRRVEGEVMRATWGNDRARFVLSDPDRKTEISVRGVASGLFEDDLSITADTAERLGLGRFEAPGRAFYAMERWPCRKVIARLKIPELGVDVPAVAFVLPGDLTDSAF